MLYTKKCHCCHNCEHLRIDNYCLIKGDYILSKVIWKINNCRNFTNKYTELVDQIISEKKSRLEQMKTLLNNTTVIDTTNSEE